MSEIRAKALSDVLRRIPLKTRKELSTQIEELCTFVGLENNFMFNRCGLYSGARNEAARVNISKAHLRRRLNLKKYWVEIVGYKDPQPCTLAEAARLMWVKEASLKVRVSSVKTFEKEICAPFSYKNKDHIDGYYICSKMTEEEQAHYEKEFSRSDDRPTSTPQHTIDMPVRQ